MATSRTPDEMLQDYTAAMGGRGDMQWAAFVPRTSPDLHDLSAVIAAIDRPP